MQNHTPLACPHAPQPHCKAHLLALFLLVFRALVGLFLLGLGLLRQCRNVQRHLIAHLWRLPPEELERPGGLAHAAGYRRGKRAVLLLCSGVLAWGGRAHGEGGSNNTAVWAMPPGATPRQHMGWLIGVPTHTTARLPANWDVACQEVAGAARSMGAAQAGFAASTPCTTTPTRTRM